MTPRTDEYEQDNSHLNATTDDDGLKQDMAALARACMFNDDETKTHSQEDPLLASGDAIVPFTILSDSDSDDLECLKRVKSRYQSTDTLPSTQMTLAASHDDDEDDFETVRAIFKRFSAYDGSGREAWDEGNQASSLIDEQDVAKCSISEYSDADELCPDSLSADNDAKLLIKPGGFDETCENDASLSSQLPKKRSSFPPSAQAFIVAIKKNRALQRFLRSKLIETEAKIEENKKQRDKVKILKDFQVTLSRRTAKAFSLKIDPRVQLISSKKSVASNKSKSQNKKVSAMCYGPDENSHVANYKMVLERFPLSLDRKKWSNKEKENLLKGIKQQFQETVLQISVDRMCSGYSPGDTNDMDIIIESVKDIEITSERIREFLPKVNWDRLAFYVCCWPYWS
ncbi:hypothetical protein P8452_66146 [Trifolium repens]|nr:hypothetical protein P8452_66146 [Trifolium repens]